MACGVLSVLLVHEPWLEIVVCVCVFLLFAFALALVCACFSLSLLASFRRPTDRASPVEDELDQESSAALVERELL